MRLIVYPTEVRVFCDIFTFGAFVSGGAAFSQLKAF